jgi:glutaredoxin 3
MPAFQHQEVVMANIKVYSTPTCPFCIRVKKFLKDNNVAFSDIDVSEDEAMVEEMVAKSGQMGVPVIDIDGQMIVGFDKDRIAEILGIKG